MESSDMSLIDELENVTHLFLDTSPLIYYVERNPYATGSNVVVISPDVAEAFPDSESVNEALRMLIRIAQQTKKSSINLKH